MRLLPLLLGLVSALGAEVRTLTLREAIDLALKQNSDILLARFDEQKAAASVREARDPFTPKLVVGSGLAYSSGFPMSIEGSAPSLLQAQAIQTLYNRPLSFQVAAARENARGAGIDATARRDEVVHRVATLYMQVQRAGKLSELIAQQNSSFEKIADTVRARVEEGRELPVEARAAELRLAQTRQRLRLLESERDTAEASLAVALGFGADDRVRSAGAELRLGDMPSSAGAASEEALSSSKELQRLQSAIQARQMQAQGARAARYPQVDLVAQYALMARFNNYEEFFNRFQRHNGQLGMSFQLPLFAGSGNSARAAQAELDIARLRVQINAARDRISLDTQRAWTEMRNFESARDLAKLDLDVTRERLGVALAQWEEGRATLRQLEELRSSESEKWLGLYDAQHAVDRARLDLLRHTGSIMAALQ